MQRDLAADFVHILPPRATAAGERVPEFGQGNANLRVDFEDLGIAVARGYREFSSSNSRRFMRIPSGAENPPSAPPDPTTR